MLSQLDIVPTFHSRGSGYTQADKGLALPRLSHSGEIALSGSRSLRPTLAEAPVLFARAVVTEAKNRTSVILFHSKMKLPSSEQSSQFQENWLGTA